MGNSIPDVDQPYEFSGASSEIMGLNIGQCEQQSCMLDLFSQLIMLVAVKQILRRENSMKAILPPPRVDTHEYNASPAFR